MGKVRKCVVRTLMIVNVLAIILLLLVGNADRLAPEEHPLLCNTGLLFPAVLVLNIIFLALWTLLRPRCLWLPVLGLLLGYGPLSRYLPVNRPSAPPHGAVRVLSWNVCMFQGDTPGDDGQGAMTRYLLRDGADIVCLQEAPLGVGDGAPVSVLRQNYPHVDVTRKNDSGSACMILATRYPIVGKRLIPYESQGNMSVEYVLSIDGRRVCLVANHLETNGLSVEDKNNMGHIASGKVTFDSAKGDLSRLKRKVSQAAVKRAPQARLVSDWIQRRLREGMPVIVVGDFNDTPISYARRTIARGLTDCYAASGLGPGFSYRSNGIWVRIDHMLCSDFFKPYGAKVDKTVELSDHYPISCWLEMRPKP